MTGDGGKPEIGDRMPDGTIYAGRSPETYKRMYTIPSDVPLRMEWEDAMIHAADHDCRVPTIRELKVIFQNRAAIGGFDESKEFWSSSEIQGHPFSASTLRFRDGVQSDDRKKRVQSVQFVRE